MSTRIFENYYNTINVKDYGAKGDGTTDDATAIQAALNAASTQKKSVVFPSATYKLNSGIIYDPSRHSIIGNGATLDFTAMATGNALTVRRTAVFDTDWEGAASITPHSLIMVVCC